MGHRWTFEECYNLAKDCKCSSEFKERNPQSYKASLRYGWLKEFTWFIPHYRIIKWSYDTCYNEAKKYTSRKQFQDNSGGAYRKALEEGWLEDYEWFVPKFKPKGYWNNYERVKNEAKKYSTRTEFYKNNQFVYNVAVNNGWIGDFIPNNADLNSRVRCVYSYEFKDYNVVYVGLTEDKERRHQQHLGIHSSGKSISPVFKFAKRNGISVPKPIYWYEECTITEAQQYEEEKIIWYKKQGWILLNKSKTGVGHGSIGGFTRKWTKEECYNEAKKYNTRTEFSRNCQSAYSKALRNGWINYYTWFSTLGNKKWTYEACKDVAKECLTRGEFVSKYKGAYEVSRKNGWLDEFIPEKNVNQYCKKTNDPNQYSMFFDSDDNV